MVVEEPLCFASLWALPETGSHEVIRRFDGLARLAAAACGAPVGLISIVGAEEQRFLGAAGLGEPWAERRTAPLAHSICHRVVSTGAQVAVEDAGREPRPAHVADGLVLPEIHLAAYLGVPLRTPEGAVVGAVCTQDHLPRPWTAEHVATVREIARQAEQLIAAIGSRADLDRLRVVGSAVARTALDAVVVADREGIIVQVNPATEQMLGRRAESMIGRQVCEVLIPPALRERHRDGMARYRQTGDTVLLGRRTRTRGMRADGSTFPVEMSLTSTEGPGAGSPPTGTSLVIAHLRDLSEQEATHVQVLALAEASRASAAGLLEVQQQLQAAVSSSTVMLYTIGMDRRVSFADGGGLALLGLTPRDVVGRTAAELYPGRPDFESAISQALCAQPVELTTEVAGRSLETTFTPLRDASGELLGTVGVTTDVTAVVAGEERLLESVNTDALTGLLTRAALHGALDVAVAQGRPIALIMADLDHFKDVNDALGHPVGDRLLNHVAQRLRPLAVHAHWARLGGDEIVVALVGEPAAHAEELAK